MYVIEVIDIECVLLSFLSKKIVSKNGGSQRAFWLVSGSWGKELRAFLTPRQIQNGGFERAILRKSGDMIRGEVRILYLVFLWCTCVWKTWQWKTAFSRVSHARSTTRTTQRVKIARKFPGDLKCISIFLTSSSRIWADSRRSVKHQVSYQPYTTRASDRPIIVLKYIYRLYYEKK